MFITSALFLCSCFNFQFRRSASPTQSLTLFDLGYSENVDGFKIGFIFAQRIVPQVVFLRKRCSSMDNISAVLEEDDICELIFIQLDIDFHLMEAAQLCPSTVCAHFHGICSFSYIVYRC